jgi:DNA-binding NarL/FixJ family response regulator
MIRVLLVDDHQLLRSSLRLRLDREPGITPGGEAGTAEEAVVRARSLQPDIVLLDLILPRRSGYDVIPELLRVSPRARILVVSSQTQPSSIRQAILAGASGYISKRASDAELIQAISAVAAGAQYVSPELGVRLVAADESPALDPISDRERDVLHLLALGYTNQEIAEKVFVSVRTVESHRAQIMRKLSLRSRAELVLFALSNGLIGAA